MSPREQACLRLLAYWARRHVAGEPEALRALQRQLRELDGLEPGWEARVERAGTGANAQRGRHGPPPEPRYEVRAGSAVVSRHHSLRQARARAEADGTRVWDVTEERWVR